MQKYACSEKSNVCVCGGGVCCVRLQAVRVYSVNIHALTHSLRRRRRRRHRQSVVRGAAQARAHTQQKYSHIHILTTHSTPPRAQPSPQIELGAANFAQWARSSCAICVCIRAKNTQAHHTPLYCYIHSTRFVRFTARCRTRSLTCPRNCAAAHTGPYNCDVVV